MVFVTRRLNVLRSPARPLICVQSALDCPPKSSLNGFAFALATRDSLPPRPVAKWVPVLGFKVLVVGTGSKVIGSIRINGLMVPPFREDGFVQWVRELTDAFGSCIKREMDQGYWNKPANPS